MRHHAMLCSLRLFLVYGYIVCSLGLQEAEGAICKELEWPCITKGQCIDQTTICDGKPDCNDGSDETFHLCSNATFTCPEYAFRCSYGACVDGDATCNGVNDCADRSDELLPSCNGVATAPKSHKCGALEFACLNGACIESHQFCDGVKDCKDSSDESVTQCYNYTCPEYAFRCAYGACVDGDAVCNGVTDCIDGSDEYAPQCNVPGVPPLPWKPSQDTKPGRKTICRLPKFPENGFYTSNSCEPDCSSLTSGTEVVRGYDINYHCKDGFSLRGPATQSCINGNWIPRATVKCSNGCDPLISRKLEIICLSPDSKILPCNETLPYNTVAHFQCRQTTHRKVEEIGYSKLTCLNGLWDKPFTDSFCRPVCGKAVEEGGFGETFIVNGTAARHGNFPWHAGIYKNQNDKWQFICGGSLITQNVILSAAHCFKHDQQNVQGLVTEDPAQMRIGLGKRYVNLHDQRDAIFAQDFGIAKVIVLPDWTGSLDDYQYDISIVILDGQVTFSAAIQPVCLDIDRNNDEEEQLVPGNVGLVPGWGFTEKGQTSDELLLAKVPYVDTNKCRNETSLPKYLKKDKICGGDKQTKQTVCNGDSGGGYVFKDVKTNSYFLRGIVSLGTPSCQGDDYALFTKVSKYTELINQSIE